MAASLFRGAASLLLVAVAMTAGAAALDKQIKLEDIERDNLQTEILRRPHAQQSTASTAQHEQLNQLRQQQLALQQQQQLHRQQQLAYHQQLQQRYSAQQQEQQHQQSPLTYHQQYQQQLQQHRELLRERERERAEHHHGHQPHQSLQHYTSVAPHQHVLQEVPAGTPHVMYLIMPGGNIAAIPIAHPNQIQALFTPVKQPLGALYHQMAAAVPTQVVQFVQPHVAVQGQAASHHLGQDRPRAQLHYIIPAQQHRFTLPTQTQHHQQAYSHPVQQHTQVEYRDAPSSANTETEYQYPWQQVPQSQKSLLSVGVKSTPSPQLKSTGGFSTQTGSSFANFRQYSG